MSPAPAPDRRPNPRLLALDTATERMFVAVVAGERQWLADEAGGAHASQRLLPLAFDLLARAGLKLGELDAVAFGRGPGAFTGLRTACSVAQGLAFGAGLPVLALDSLALVAEDVFAQHDAAALRLWVAMDARMDEAYAAAGPAGEVAIIGGSAIFAEALPAADVIYLTEVDADVEGDVFFPPFDRSEWREVELERHAPDDRHAYAFRILKLERK